MHVVIKAPKGESSGNPVELKMTDYEGLKKGEGLERYPPHFQLMNKKLD